MLLLGLGAAWAQSDDASRYWEQVWDARVVDAMYGDPALTLPFLRESLDDMPTDHPERGDVLYWYARVRLEAGESGEAELLLREAAGFPGAEREANAMLARLRLVSNPIAHLPFTCGFERDTCGLQRAWDSMDKGLLEVRDAGDSSVLAWDTIVRGAENDSVLVAIAEGQVVRGVGLRVRATQMGADLRVSIGDGSGGRWSSPMYRVPTDDWLTIELPLAAFAPLNPLPQSRVPPAVRVLVIEDATGMFSTDRGPNTLLLDDLVVR